LAEGDPPSLLVMLSNFFSGIHNRATYLCIKRGAKKNLVDNFSEVMVHSRFFFLLLMSRKFSYFFSIYTVILREGSNFFLVLKLLLQISSC
jgi:hypothetical protein